MVVAPVAAIVAVVIVRLRFPGRYRWRTAARRRLPSILINLGIAAKGKDDCGDHDWYRSNGGQQRCYHCDVGARTAPRDSA